MRFSLFEATNKGEVGKEAIGAVENEVFAANSYAVAITIFAQMQFKSGCFKGEGMISRATWSFTLWVCTSKLIVHVLNFGKKIYYYY
ncbi:hypothetical protein V6N12_064761 [Hibiscus sabdariffa]